MPDLPTTPEQLKRPRCFPRVCRILASVSVLAFGFGQGVAMAQPTQPVGADGRSSPYQDLFRSNAYTVDCSFDSPPPGRHGSSWQYWWYGLRAMTKDLCGVDGSMGLVWDAGETGEECHPVPSGRGIRPRAHVNYCLMTTGEDIEFSWKMDHPYMDHDALVSDLSDTAQVAAESLERLLDLWGYTPDEFRSLRQSVYDRPTIHFAMMHQGLNPFPGAFYKCNVPSEHTSLFPARLSQNCMPDDHARHDNVTSLVTNRTHSTSILEHNGGSFNYVDLVPYAMPHEMFHLFQHLQTVRPNIDNSLAKQMNQLVMFEGVPNVYAQQWVPQLYEDGYADRCNNWGYYHTSHGIYADIHQGLLSSVWGGGAGTELVWTHYWQQDPARFDTAYTETLFRSGRDAFLGSGEGIDFHATWHDFALKLYNAGDGEVWPRTRFEQSTDVLDSLEPVTLPDYPKPDAGPDIHPSHRFQLPVHEAIHSAPVTAFMPMASVKMYRFQRDTESSVRFQLIDDRCATSDDPDVPASEPVRATLLMTDQTPADGPDGVIVTEEAGKRLELPFCDEVLVCFDESTKPCEGTGDEYTDIKTIDIVLSNSSWDDEKVVTLVAHGAARYRAVEIVSIDPEVGLPESPVGFREDSPLSLDLQVGDDDHGYYLKLDAEHAWFDFSPEFYKTNIPQEESGDPVHWTHIGHYISHGAGFRGTSELYGKITNTSMAEDGTLRHSLELEIEEVGRFYRTHHGFLVDPDRVDPLPMMSGFLQAPIITAAHQKYGPGSFPWRVQYAIYQIFHLGVEPNEAEGEMVLQMNPDGTVELELSRGYRIKFEEQP